jgi:hypothetical protein
LYCRELAVGFATSALQPTAHPAASGDCGQMCNDAPAMHDMGQQYIDGCSLRFYSKPAKLSSTALHREGMISVTGWFHTPLLISNKCHAMFPLLWIAFALVW